MAGLRNRAKDFHRCLRNMASFSDGQARVKDWESDDLSSLVVEVTPNDGPYFGGSFCFQIVLDDDFPSHPPDVTCTSNIYHPNIDNTATENVCLNLFEEWQDGFGLEDCIQGLLFLLHNPNLEDPLSPHFDVGMDEEEFVDNVRKTLIGEEVEGVNFTDWGNNDESEAEDDSSSKNSKNEDSGIDVILEKVEDLLKTVAEDDDDDDDDTEKPGDVITTETNGEVTDSETTEIGKLANSTEVQEGDPQNEGEGLDVGNDGELREEEREKAEEEEETEGEREGGGETEETVDKKSNSPDAPQPMVEHRRDFTLRLSPNQFCQRLYLFWLLPHMNATTLTRSLTGLDPFVEGGILLAQMLCNNFFHTNTRTS